MPAELERADYAVSSNIGRTSTHPSAVIDVRLGRGLAQQQG